MVWCIKGNGFPSESLSTLSCSIPAKLNLTTFILTRPWSFVISYISLFFLSLCTFSSKELWIRVTLPTLSIWVVIHFLFIKRHNLLMSLSESCWSAASYCASEFSFGSRYFSKSFKMYFWVKSKTFDVSFLNNCISDNWIKFFLFSNSYLLVWISILISTTFFHGYNFKNFNV